MSTTIKAWSCCDDMAECGYIIFTTSRSMAHAIAIGLPGFDCSEWNNIRVVRLPAMDGKRDCDCVLDWSTDAREYYEAGWWPMDGSVECEFCGLFEYEQFPESRVTEREDGNICAACMEQERKEKQVGGTE